MDLWFPVIALFCGLFMQVSLQLPEAARNLEKIHPIPGSLQRMDRISWVLIIVGSLWELQNLLV